MIQKDRRTLPYNTRFADKAVTGSQDHARPVYTPVDSVFNVRFLPNGIEQPGNRVEESFGTSRFVDKIVKESRFSFWKEGASVNAGSPGRIAK